MFEDEECPVCFWENPRLMFECFLCGEQLCNECVCHHDCLPEPDPLEE